jgi:hypothetical protein
MNLEPVLECQICGEVVRKLTDSEAQQVAANPYNFIVTCRAHRGMA